MTKPYMRTLRRWLMTFGVTACTILCASGTRTIAAGERIDDDSRHFRHRLARLESLIEKQRQTLQIPGLAVVVIHQDQVVFLKGFGFRDLETDFPITPDSLFGIGSCTKAFTGLAAVISAEMGKLSLEDSPKKFLPYFQMSDAKADAQVTLLDMLTHRTGLKAYDDEVWHKNDKLSREEVIKAVMLKPLSAKFRTKFQYNNVMYSAVGECIGIANNSSWEGVISNRIFQPLEMNSSNTSMRAMRNAPNFTIGYHLPAARPLREKDHDLDNVAASGAINSTARDMAQWIRFMLGQGVFEGRRLISESSWQKLITPGIGNYALGWSVLDINSHKTLFSEGGAVGHAARVTLDLDAKAGWAVLANVNDVREFRALADLLEKSLQPLENGSVWRSLTLALTILVWSVCFTTVGYRFLHYRKTRPSSIPPSDRSSRRRRIAMGWIGASLFVALAVALWQFERTQPWIGVHLPALAWLRSGLLLATIICLEFVLFRPAKSAVQPIRGRLDPRLKD